MITIVVGTRPNVIKLNPLVKQLNKNNLKQNKDYTVVHTGQHYDYDLSQIFFNELNIQDPDKFLNVNHANELHQMLEIMSSLYDYCFSISTKKLIVIGDVNSTVAASLVASRLSNTKLYHVESGYRSFDKTMPEELNRIMTDHLSNILFCNVKEAIYNLKNEGIYGSEIILSGDLVIESLKDITNTRVQNPINNQILLTIHRQSNTNIEENLSNIVEFINTLSSSYNVIFPIHPRTKNSLSKFNLKLNKNIELLPPQSYINFINLITSSSFVITDSGGLQVESFYLNKPTLILRQNTEHTYLLNGKTKLVKNLSPFHLLCQFNAIKDNSHIDNVYPDEWSLIPSEIIVNKIMN
jgi:UDP-N-acetylglucosamine 2-epimerase